MGRLRASAFVALGTDIIWPRVEVRMEALPRVVGEGRPGGVMTAGEAKKTQTQIDKQKLERELAPKGHGFSAGWLQGVLSRGLTSRPEIADPKCAGLVARVEAGSIIFRWYVKQLFSDGRPPKSRVITIGEFTPIAYPGKMKLAQAQGWVLRLKEANHQRRLHEVEAQLEAEKALDPEFSMPKRAASPDGEKTVTDAAQLFYDRAVTSGPTARRESQWRHARRVLFQIVVPALGERDLGEITPAMCADIIEGIARTTPNWAGKVASNMSQLFRYCQARGWLVSNPCAGLDFRLLGAHNGKQKKRALAPGEIALFWHGLDARKIDSPRGLDEVVKLGVRFCLVVPDRSGELLLSAKSEFDLHRGLWTVPVAHQKLSTQSQKESAEAMPVPLSWLAIEILQKLFALDPNSPWTLPSELSENGRLNVNSLHQAMRRTFGDRKGKIAPS
jgi:integrase